MADTRLTRITVQALAAVHKLPARLPDRNPNVQASLNSQLPQPSSSSLATATETVAVVLNETAAVPATAVAATATATAEIGVKRKRGRPPRNPGVASPASPALMSNCNKKSKNEKEDEDVCFICFDGGNLVLCDRRDCPKAYHPACVKRDEAFFRPNIRWTCGWHLCNYCQRNALFMCYSCPYSLCKKCVKQADILRVRGNKGFCRTCMKTIMLIENIPHESKEQVQVDFDDITSWEYLFKVYWIYLKEKEGLTIDELTRASNPWKVCGPENDSFLQKGVESCISESSNNVQLEALKRRKTSIQPQLPCLESRSGVEPDMNNVSSSYAVADWASKELLEFVAHMKNGETPVLTQFDVQALLLDYIKKNNLRDPRRKCQIICDKRLEKLFGKQRVGHFEMLKLLEFHFKEESRTNGVVRSASVDPLAGPLQNEGNCGDAQNPSRETRRQSRRKAEEKDRQNKLDSYAAIDVHNINLIYLKQSLLDNLMVDAVNFHNKVVGSVVRIKISSNDQKQDMHRLVRIIGTSKATEPNKIGDKAESFMLKILNLNKIEDIAINAISDQEFSEDECRRLRQSIKLGLVERMTVGEVQEKAMALQAVRVDELLELEIRKLNHLRDRASEMGHRKELRECVEKIELLKSPEERLRRIHEIPDVHADPRMDPSYGSDDDSGESDIKKQDGSVTPRHQNLDVKGAELISPVRTGNNLKDDGAKVLKLSVANGDRKRKNSARFHVGKVEGSKRPLESCKSERVDASKTLEQLNNRTSLDIVSDERGTTANGPVAQAVSDSKGQTTLPPRMLLVSDISELEKMWHYQDPSGKVQGPFCMLQLRKWHSNGFFPTDLRVWKISESSDQSILLTDALKQQLSSEPEPNVKQQSDCGGEFNDKKFNSFEEMSSNTDDASVSDKKNEESSNKSLTDVTATSEADDLPSNGFTSLLISDDQGGTCQSGLDMKARLIESLFDTEEPSSIATPTGSSETMQINHNFESSYPSTSTSKFDNVITEDRVMRSQPSSPNAGRQYTRDEWALAPNGAQVSDPRSTTPNSNPEDLKSNNLENHHVSSNISEDFDLCYGTRPGTTLFSQPSRMPIIENKELDNDTQNKHSAPSVGYEQESGTGSTISPRIGVSMTVSASKEVENEGLKPHEVAHRHSTLNAIRQDSEARWSTISDGTNVTVLPSNKTNMEGTKPHAVEDKHYVSNSNAPIQDSGTSWSTISSGIVFSDLPSTALKLESNNLETPAVENKANVIANVPGHSGTSWRSMSLGLGFSDLPTTSLKLDDTSGGQVMGIKNLAISNVHGQDSCISWSTASNLVGGEVHLPDVASEWGAYSTVHVKPVEEFNTVLVSGSSSKLAEVAGDHATPTSHSCQMNTLHCDISSWQPIELSVLGDDSVSDLLSEVEAMESLRGISSPTCRINCGDDSIDSPGDDCFSPLRGLSLHLDAGKNDALSSTADLHFHVDLNISSQSHGPFTIHDLPRTSCILASGSLELEEGKAAIASMPLQNFFSDTPVSVVLPPPPQSPPLPPSLPSASPLPPPSLPSPPPPPPTAAAASVPPPSVQSPLPSTSVPPPLPPVSVPPPPPPVSVPSPSPLAQEEKWPSSQPPPSTLSFDCPSSPKEEGEVEPTLLLHHQRELGLHQSSSQPATMKVAAADSRKRGSENTSPGWDSSGHPSGKYPETSSILGTPNLHWSSSGSGIAAANVNPHWSTSVASQGTRGSSQTSPRYSSQNNVGRHSGSKDRSHHHHGVDSGFSKSRPTQWSRQSSFGGGSSRPPPSRGPRVCKFYESGYCRKGASCKYLHP